jgi:Tol biopolymer transport system component
VVPDGTQIAFASMRNENADVYVMPADGGAAQRLTEDESTDWEPTWSPDGQQIAFRSERDGDWNIYTVSVIGGAVSPVTTDLARDANPAWTP